MFPAAVSLAALLRLHKTYKQLFGFGAAVYLVGLLGSGFSLAALLPPLAAALGSRNKTEQLFDLSPWDQAAVARRAA